MSSFHWPAAAIVAIRKIPIQLNSEKIPEEKLIGKKNLQFQNVFFVFVMPFQTKK